MHEDLNIWWQTWCSGVRIQWTWLDRDEEHSHVFKFYHILKKFRGSPRMQRKKVWLSTHACVLSRFSRVCLFATLWAVSHQAPQITGFSREEYWREVPCPSPGDPPDPGIEPKAPALQADFFFTTEPLGNIRKNIITDLLNDGIYFCVKYWAFIHGKRYSKCWMTISL